MDYERDYEKDWFVKYPWLDAANLSYREMDQFCFFKFHIFPYQSLGLAFVKYTGFW